MKYPLVVTAISLLGLYVAGNVAYRLTHQEQCPVAVEYSLPGMNSKDAANLKNETALYAKKSGYKYMDSSLDGSLTIYAPKDPDRLIVNLNDTGTFIKVAFHDCRAGGNGAATGNAWFSAIGRRYL